MRCLWCVSEGTACCLNETFTPKLKLLGTDTADNVTCVTLDKSVLCVAVRLTYPEVLKLQGVGGGGGERKARKRRANFLAFAVPLITNFRLSSGVR